MTRPDWTAYFLSIAKAVGTRATCPRASVGAVLVSQDHHILSTGFNGSPPGEPHCLDVGCQIEDGHCQRTLHAEVNAIAWAARKGVAVDGATLYVHVTKLASNRGWTKPCRECRKVIEAANVRSVVFGEDVLWNPEPVE